MADEESPYIVVMVFTEQMQREMERLMQEAGYHWIDFRSIDVPDYFQFPYQVRYTFQHAPAPIGDEDYEDWRPGDVFLHDGDPDKREHTARQVDHEHEYIYFPDPDRPGEEAMARFTRLRRVRKASSAPHPGSTDLDGLTSEEE